MRDFLKHLIHNFRFNIKTLILFEFLYKLFSFGVIIPLTKLLFRGIITLTGTGYLTGESLSRLLLNPLFYILTAVLLLLMAVYSMIDISAVIFIYDRSEEERKTTLLETLVFSLKNSIRVFSRWNFLIALVNLFMIPFCNLGVGISFIGTVRLPDFWRDYLSTHPIVFILALCGVLLMIYFLINWIYSYSYFTLEKKRFRLARHYSRLLAKGHELKGALALLIAQGILVLLYFLISAGGVLVIALIEKALSLVTVPSAVVYTALTVFFIVLLFLLSSMAVPVSFLIITTLFYKYKKDRGYVVIHAGEVFKKPSVDKQKMPSRRTKKIIWYFAVIASAVVLIIFASDYTYGLATGRYDLRMEGGNVVTVTAHRGASAYYPENTYEAVEGAFEMGADHSEIDVRKTKDGRLAVIHDKNLKHLTGQNINVWDITMDEIKKLDAGSGFSKEFAGTRIAELSEILQFSKKTGFRLNVEIKPHGHGDDDIAQLVVSEINSSGAKNNCTISSNDYDVLRDVKMIDPSIKTFFISSLAFGDPKELGYADGLSIEATFATKELIHAAHLCGKPVCVWTVNDSWRAETVLAAGADDIITDDIRLAKDCIYRMEEAGWTLGWYTEFARSLLR